MYLTHFGLTRPPFGITPDPDFFYSGNTRGAILEALLYAVSHGEGIIKVTGEVGSGKTMLCRMLESQLPTSVVVIYLVNPSLGPEEVLYTIGGELGLDIRDRRSDEVLRLLHADLIARHTAGQQVVLLVEEAQAMPLETLEEIRLLTNLETAHYKLLQIVLFGQPELEASLLLPTMRQLRERITHSFTVPPMEAEVIGEFLDFRLAAAGYRGPALFTAEAEALVAQVSQGIVRRVTILADKAMLAAYAGDASRVTEKHVRAAVLDSPFGQLPRAKPRQGAAIAVMAAALVAAVGWQIVHMAPGALGMASAKLSAAIPLPSSGVARPASNASPAKLPQTPANASPTLLQQALADTTVWLAKQPDQHLVLQITVLPMVESRRVEQFLQTTRDAIGLESIHVHPFMLAGVPHIAVIYGNFNALSSAEAAQRLLSDNKEYRPRIIAIKTIREEVQLAANLGI